MVLIRLNTPSAPNNDLQRIVKEWQAPQDSSRLLDPFPPHFSDDLNPIPCHSHNDYSHRVPVFQALAAGCISIEADIYLPSASYIQTHSLRTDDVLVGHSRRSLRPDRTLRSLYTEPLLRILTGMNDVNSTELNGVFSNHPIQSLTLLLDFKETSDSGLSDMWDKMQAHLEAFRSPETQYLTTFSGNTQLIRPLTIVVSGSAPFEFILNPVKNPHKDVFFDAPLHELRPEPDDPSPYNISNSYLASTSLKAYIGNPSLLSGRFAASQLEQLESQISQAKELGLVPRYWGTPRWPVSERGYVWTTLWRLGVGLLNVDAVEVAARWDWEKVAGLLGWCWIVGVRVGDGC